MAYQPNQNPMLGATFVPGGFDDYYMPNPNTEVVSPAPQRVMPEVPEQMQDSIARLELDANQSPRTSSAPQSLPIQQTSSSTPAPAAGAAGMDYNGYGHGRANDAPNVPAAFPQNSTIPQQQQHPTQNHDYRNVANLPDIPNFTPFPRLENRPAGVPPSDEEKESILESARTHVLNSNDPEMQLAWAQDALAYVDCAMVHEERVSKVEPARSVTPAVEHQLRIDAMNVVNFLADQQHPKAEFLRGMWLEFGKFGLRMDKREAFRSYSRAAEKGYWRAEYRIGMQFEQSNDAVKALQHYKRGSEMGDSASNYRLGMMTLLGQHSQPQDYGKGVQLIRQAAATADENAPQGAYILGMLQARELPQVQVPEVFLPFSEKDARANIERAAFLGFSKAQLKMGQAYELCNLGCEFSPKLSLHYNALAARQGELEADMAISKWFLCGYEGLFAKNEELAYMHANRAAQGGLATAEFALGYFHEIGMYVLVNIDKAMEWYEKAAKNGNKDAESRIDGISKSRTLSKKDHEDVAINRIKSQYGSRRGQRPDRFKQRDSTLPSLNESSPSEYSQATPISPTSSRPDRLNTTTPYPMSNGPPQIAPIQPMSPIHRSATAAPYPMGDGPGGMLGQPTASSFLNPEFRSASAAPAPTQRPSSAFQVNPNIYQDDGRRPEPPRTQGYGNGPLPPRASSTAYGEGSPYPGAGGRQPNGRIASNPPPGAYSGPQGQYPTGPGGPGGPNGPGGRRPRDDYPRPQPGDMGFQAPLEIRKQRPGTSGPPSSQAGPPPGIGYEAPLPQKQQSRPSERPGSARPTVQPPRTDSRPPQGGGPSPRRDTNTPPQQKPLPSPQQQKPFAPSGAQKPGTASAKPGAASSKPGTPAGGAAGSKPATPAAAPSSKPPGVGPKTFDEMGVPKTKQDSDCIVM